MSERLYTGLVLLVAVVRLVELRVARSHDKASFAHGGVEFGRSHYPLMVALHVGFLLGCVAEVWLLDRPFLPWLGWPMLVLLVAAHALRWWCIRALGQQWTTRVIVVPGAGLVTSGPYRYLRHPNYVAVVLEGIALPMVHTAWVTALVFTVLNGALLTVRIRVEERGLLELAPAPR
jgi:methyltransferase